ncbi:MAG: ABC transporter permease [bacterium]|nr:ABC transporter permease [bacterium]
MSVARKELRQLLRDRLTMGFVVGVPAIQLLLFGYAINQDIRHIPTGLVDHSNTSISRQLVGELQATQTFDVTEQVRSEQEARRLLERGAIRAAVVVPADYARAYYRGRGAEILVLVDAADPILARAVRASANGLMERHNRRQQQFDVGTEGGARRVTRERTSFGAEPELIRPEFLRFEVLNLYNPELRTPVFVVPALLGVILTTTMILMTSLSIVRERERGSFEFLIATPVRRTELMAGKLLPYIGIGLVQIVIVVVTGLVLFEVPIAGSLLDLGVASLVFIAANLTLGLVISSVTTSQFQATQMSFFFFLPSVLLSGFMFPFEAMPKPAQWLGELLPLTHFIRASRGILLRGSSLVDQLPELGAMLLFCAVGFWAATRLFTKQL